MNSIINRHVCSFAENDNKPSPKKNNKPKRASKEKLPSSKRTNKSLRSVPDMSLRSEAENLPTTENNKDMLTIKEIEEAVEPMPENLPILKSTEESTRPISEKNYEPVAIEENVSNNLPLTRGDEEYMRPVLERNNEPIAKEEYASVSEIHMLAQGANEEVEISEMHLKDREEQDQIFDKYLASIADEANNDESMLDAVKQEKNFQDVSIPTDLITKSTLSQKFEFNKQSHQFQEQHEHEEDNEDLYQTYIAKRQPKLENKPPIISFNANEDAKKQERDLALQRAIERNILRNQFVHRPDTVPHLERGIDEMSEANLLSNKNLSVGGIDHNNNQGFVTSPNNSGANNNLNQLPQEMVNYYYPKDSNNRNENYVRLESKGHYVQQHVLPQIRRVMEDYGIEMGTKANDAYQPSVGNVELQERQEENMLEHQQMTSQDAIPFNERKNNRSRSKYQFHYDNMNAVTTKVENNPSNVVPPDVKTNLATNMIDNGIQNMQEQPQILPMSQAVENIDMINNNENSEMYYSSNQSLNDEAANTSTDEGANVPLSISNNNENGEIYYSSNQNLNDEAANASTDQGINLPLSNADTNVNEKLLPPSSETDNSPDINDSGQNIMEKSEDETLPDALITPPTAQESRTNSNEMYQMSFDMKPTDDITTFSQTRLLSEVSLLRGSMGSKQNKDVLQ